MTDCNSTTERSLTSGLEAMSLKAISPSKLNRRHKVSSKPDKLNENVCLDRRAEVLVNTENEMPTEIVSKIKNENFHLQLELEQKNHEISKLKSMLLPKLTPPAIDLRLTTSLKDPLYYHPESNKIPGMSGATVTNSDYVSHFSSSSYDGNRNDVRETSTVASTTISRKEKNHMLFTRNILPFIRDSINMYKNSHVLNEEVVPIEKELDKFYDNSLKKDEKCEVFSNVLLGLLRVQRLNIAALNRELELKTVERKMDYLATLFLDPQEYEIPRHSSMKRIRDQMLDVIISLYGELPNPNQRAAREMKYQQPQQVPLKIKSDSKLNRQSHNPEILPIGYSNSSSKPARSAKKRMRNIKLTPFKTASQEDMDADDDLDVDLSDPLQLLLAERITGTDLENTTSLTNSL
ncbi:uncharacterized protein KLLA0_D02068g [Kluyveromyces lactis]|uniref:KLLA0D02068p n=1 Tax=Kluyveromyces lactis (strain ATCC 8585 / CBS 2359 / DSM 70799 / NBRC 1267 / NRRL Y-1140 / WM37) TaxID=284590 RepID=Q6CSC9_KLULA|nr:uncharacterized protein KLLA0_D02068g [Kluyveromyces lactis]CAH00256.1 KLLA0D02068p [Kluyveromyces lactis]|eukprot:XP_453160.1 uncharacterized protein KLLA0_D02068g [Kluyveromyces lactis]